MHRRRFSTITLGAGISCVSAAPKTQILRWESIAGVIERPLAFPRWAKDEELTLVHEVKGRILQPESGETKLEYTMRAWTFSRSGVTITSRMASLPPALNAERLVGARVSCSTYARHLRAGGDKPPLSLSPKATPEEIRESLPRPDRDTVTGEGSGSIILARHEYGKLVPDARSEHVFDRGRLTEVLIGWHHLKESA